MPDSPTTTEVDSSDRFVLEEAVAAWRAELAAAGGADPLTRYRDLPEGTLDLATAHPSGLAGILAGRPTRLSSLFREPAALSDARRRARAIRLAAAALAEEHGLRSAHLAVGMVSWRGPAAGDDDGVVTGPVLLRPVTLRPRGAGHVDYDFDLAASVHVNPAVVRLLAQQGLRLDVRELESLATRGPGFDPAPAYRRLAEVAGGLPGFTVRPRLVVSTFVDLAPALVAELDRLAPAFARNDVVAALAGDPGAVTRLASVASSRGRRVTDGTEDVRVLPLDRDQRGVLEAVAAGRSVRVEAPPGTGGTQVLAAVLAGLAATGRRTLLVAAHRAEIRTVTARLGSVGLTDLVHAESEEALARPDQQPDVDEPRSTRAGNPLATLRRQHDALHSQRTPWKVSALQAMHALARLTSADPAPRTAVQLPPDVLRRLDGPTREAAAAALREAADLGAFDRGARQAPWFGAELSGEDETAAVLAATSRLTGELLPALRAEMERLTSDAGLGAATSVAGWGRQLDLLVGVRGTLDVFTPAVYERPVGDMVTATAPAAWRAERGVSMGLWERRRWEKQARELLRPGSSPPSLHAALVAAQEQRSAWQQLSAGGGWPRVPTGLAAVDARYAEVVAELRRLETVLAGSPQGGRLVDSPLPDLQRRLERLGGDTDVLRTLPRRTAALTLLRDLGLNALVEDLRDRACPAGQVGAELDLAWWRSLLQLLLAEDRDLAGADATAYESALNDVRVGDRRQQRAVARRVRDAVAVAGGAPCLATSPHALPQEVPPTAEFDVVVLAGAHRIGAAEGALALARAHQVVVVGDPGGLPPATVTLRAERLAGEEDVEPAGAGRRGVLDVLDGALPTLHLRHQHRMPAQVASAADAVVAPAHEQHRVPAPPAVASVRLELVPDGTGHPGPDGAVESVEAEVDRVVTLVLDHARTRPDQSLAVVSMSRLHAKRVADALRADLPDHPDLARWMAGGTAEPFVVTDADRAEDAVRDAVIVTIGFGRTPHGRVLHRFGRLDADGGDRRLAVAVSRARRSLTVVSCLAAADLDPERLRTAGSIALRSLLADLGRPEPDGADAGSGPTDPLLADLSRRLAARGRRPEAGSGSHGPELVVPAAGEQAAPVAVVTDLPTAPTDDDLVERQLLVPAQLQRFGWRVVRLGAVGLFTDPDGQVRRVLGAQG